jgi:hypothetical protein
MPTRLYGALGAHCVYEGCCCLEWWIYLLDGQCAIGAGVSANVWFLLKAVDTTDKECEGGVISDRGSDLAEVEEFATEGVKE